MLRRITLPRCLAMLGAVCALSFALPGAAAASGTGPRASAAAAVPGPTRPRLPVLGHESTTTTTLPKVPAKAEPILRKLLKEADVVSADDQSAAGISERYDLARYGVSTARHRVVRSERQLRVARQRLSVAAGRLRAAAVAAYVAGEFYGANANVLFDNQSQGQMAGVYSGVALGELGHALSLYRGAVVGATRTRSAALGEYRQLMRNLAVVSSLRRRAETLIRKASRQYLLISARLRRLVGAKEFATLFSPWPSGAPYRGPNLAGTLVGLVATPGEGRRAVEAAKRFLGVPYVFGGAGKAGVDCSGLTMLAWAVAGIGLVHSATLQWEESQPVSLADLQPGDLLFYHFAHDGPGAISHVVMYVGAGPYGVETVIQAAEPGTSVELTRIYFEGFVGAGRP